jgi:hypothetical protein
MCLLNARLFPDSSHSQPDLVAAAVVYFDALVVPCIPRLPPFEPGTPLWESLKGFGADVDAAYCRTVRLRELGDLLKELIAAGIVSSNEDTTAFDEDISEAVTSAMNDTNVSALVDVAAENAGVFASSGFSASRPRPPEIEKAVARLEYIFAAYRAAFGAARQGHHLVTTSVSDYRAVRALQQCKRDLHAEAMPSAARLIQLTLPTVMARNAEDVMEIRDRLRDYLEPFRVEIARITANLPEVESDEELAREVQRAIDRDVRPKVEELRRYLRSPSATLRRQLVADSGSLALSGVAMLGALMSGAPTALTLAAAPFTHLLASALRARQERLEKMANSPFTFALLAEADAERF